MAKFKKGDLVRCVEGARFITEGRCYEVRGVCRSGRGGENAYEWGLDLSARACKRIFGHAPKRGELLCVTKTQKGWKSEKIDLEFSD